MLLSKIRDFWMLCRIKLKTISDTSEIRTASILRV